MDKSYPIFLFFEKQVLFFNYFYEILQWLKKIK